MRGGDRAAETALLALAILVRMLLMPFESSVCAEGNFEKFGCIALMGEVSALTIIVTSIIVKGSLVSGRSSQFSQREGKRNHVVRSVFEAIVLCGMGLKLFLSYFILTALIYSTMCVVGPMTKTLTPIGPGGRTLRVLRIFAKNHCLCTEILY